VNIKALFVTILIIFASSTLHGASFKAVEKLTTDSTQKRLQALLKKGYQCEKSGPAPSSSWHCLEPGRGTLRLCLKSQNSPSKQDLPLFGWPDQLTAKR
jgi:hypothetical protein